MLLLLCISTEKGMSVARLASAANSMVAEESDSPRSGKNQCTETPSCSVVPASVLNTCATNRKTFEYREPTIFLRKNLKHFKKFKNNGVYRIADTILLVHETKIKGGVPGITEAQCNNASQSMPIKQRWPRR